MTEGYTCLGLDQHPLILKWTHRACNEPWFVPEWEAIERASELSWELGIRSDRNFSLKDCNNLHVGVVGRFIFLQMLNYVSADFLIQSVFP